VEVHIMQGYQEDFYGRQLRVLALGFIRWVHLHTPNNPCQHTTSAAALQPLNVPSIAFA
jgi:hypothetical protein